MGVLSCLYLISRCLDVRGSLFPTCLRQAIVDFYFFFFFFFFLVAFRGADLNALRIPTLDQFLQCYFQQTGIPGIDNWDFYIAFNHFRGCAILEGVYKRFLIGKQSIFSVSTLLMFIRLFACLIKCKNVFLLTKRVQNIECETFSFKTINLMIESWF